MTRQGHTCQRFGGYSAMQRAIGLWIGAMGLAPDALIAPGGALEPAPLSATMVDDGARLGLAPDRVDLLSLIAADPLLVPLAVTGGAALLVAVLLRRRRRRRVAWGYVPAQALRRRLLARLR